MAIAVARARTPLPVRPATTGLPLLAVDSHAAVRQVFSPGLFGLGADLLLATYTHLGSATCATLKALPDAARVPTLLRIGATIADDYDWRSDTYVGVRSGRPLPASFPCTPAQPAASVLRLLDRARGLAATPVVVLNGETDDPQSAAALVRLITRRYGPGYAQNVYWEIGNAPARWQHFGVPLSDTNRPNEHINCSPDQYAAVVTSYAAAIAAALHTASPRIIADDWITNATDQSWTGVVTLVDTQYYPFNAPESPPGESAVAQSLTHAGPDAATLDQQLDNLRANLEQYQGGHDVRLFVGAWNLDASPQANDPFYNSSGQAVFVARLLLHLARSADGVDLAAWAPPPYGSTQLGSTQAPFINGQPSPGFRVFAALRALAGSRLVPITQIAGGAAAHLNALALRRLDGRLTVVLSNDAGHGALALRLQLATAPRDAAATIQTFAPTTPNGATNTHVLSLNDGRVSVPALGVVILTVSA